MKANHPHANPPARQALSLVGWIAFCFIASGSAAFVFTGGWYADLHKPSWNPPAWIFAPVWTSLYVMMAVAVWLVWREGGWKTQWRALGLFLLQWLLNALWTPLFFGMHRPGLSFIDIILLWLVLAATLRLFWKVRKAAGILLIPYLAWVSFAVALNFTIWWLNP
ncbi:TspO/MBR family protein [Fundidesulfovibrio putealis]|uniref:TspO/MBR family protein n=1 Tax=Fundidesulfovibrio putealis TaxID=270496 RepID=UPI001969A40A|nr:TspO/MBR family protein [Fundidesulfovibrio putealis]